jgi:hypothetical protein
VNLGVSMEKSARTLDTAVAAKRATEKNVLYIARESRKSDKRYDAM